MPETKKPGQFGHVSFPITASIVLIVAVVSLTAIYAYRKEWRETMMFCATATAVAAGALSAYYLGKTLLQTLTQAEEAIQAQRVSLAFEFMSRWNDPGLKQRKHDFRGLIESGSAHDADKLEELIKDRPDDKTTIVEILNFFEETALAANRGYADGDVLHGYFKGSLTQYYTTLETWIKKHRAIKNRPNMWIEIEELVKKWNPR